ncbi:MAG: hypothetical protein FD175_1920 [Beijerinckiaceae bacterium]|nr:MAG: hypothetical protein FD175_1920 [Beijerinckiaceae bacterium]
MPARNNRACFAVRTCATFLAILCAALTTLVSTAHPQGISLNDEIIADPITGAALLGFDPVAYFIDHRAVPGDRGRQVVFGGKVWYFKSTANRIAFESSPQTYLPAFGGHDPVAIAAGFVVAGSPEFFLIDKDRVFLFRHAESRDAFAQDPSIGLTAEQNWPQVKRDLVP